jgi:hypothetical protein
LYSFSSTLIFATTHDPPFIGTKAGQQDLFLSDRPESCKDILLNRS